jgi:pimeloyl-[acyl-carrier protein] methyl ester esterase
VKTVAFFHGWGASGSIWRRQAAALGPRRRVLTPDIGAWEPDWFQQYLEGLPLSQSVLVGWSLGGMLLAEALARHPGPGPGGLILVGVPPVFCRRPDYPFGQPAAAVRAMRRDLGDDPQKVLADFAAACLAPGEASYRTEVEPFFRSPAHPENLAAGLDRLLAQDLRPSLGRIPAKPLIVQGTEDRIVAAAQAKFLQENLPGSRLHLLPGAGHLPFWTAAAAFNGMLEEILRGGPGENDSPALPSNSPPNPL